MNRIVKNPKKFFLVSILIDVAGFLIAALFILPHLQTDPDARIALAVYFFSFIVIGVVLGAFIRPLLKEQQITEKGEKAWAKLLRFWDTGTSINDNPLVGMQLEVYPPAGVPYQAQTSTVIPRLSVGSLRQGARAAVMFDPNKPEKVAFVSFNENQDYPEPERSFLQVRLAELEDLHDRRMIADADYQKRRQELMSS